VAACIINPQMKRSLGRLADRIAGEIDRQAADAIAHPFTLTTTLTRVR
jgi:hypothetical protein